MHNTLPYNLKQLRKINKVYQKDMANLLSISDRQYQKYEYGQQEPSIDKLLLLSNYFNVSIDYLVGNNRCVKELPIEEQNLFDEFRNLSPENKEKLLDYLKYLNDKK